MARQALHFTRFLPATRARPALYPFELQTFCQFLPAHLCCAFWRLSFLWLRVPTFKMKNSPFARLPLEITDRILAVQDLRDHEHSPGCILRRASTTCAYVHPVRPNSCFCDEMGITPSTNNIERVCKDFVARTMITLLTQGVLRFYTEDCFLWWILQVNNPMEILKMYKKVEM
jgi:hypothetical protein